MTDRLFGTSGIRRKAVELAGEFTINLGKALGTYSPDPMIAVGRDTRLSGPALRDQFIAGLNTAGKEVVDLGIVPTPTAAMASEEYGTSVIITASHNPPEYNGFKFWREGKAYSPEDERFVERIFRGREYRQVELLENKIRDVDYIGKHRTRILEWIGSLEKKVKILVDCANGAGTVITPGLLEELGCTVQPINTEMEGIFAHGLEPTVENLSTVCTKVKESDVDVGIVHDGDADRSAAIDSKGKLIDWDSFLAVLAYGKDKVVTTVDASMRIEEVCKKVIRTPVGDVAVANAVRINNADFGGEPSGSFIFPQVHLFPDGVLTAAVVAKLISENQFYEVLDKINNYPTERVKIPCTEEGKAAVMENIRDAAKKIDFNVDYTDGVRFASEDGWFLIRPSGTESFMRITAEARSDKRLRELVDEGKKLIKEASNNT